MRLFSERYSKIPQFQLWTYDEVIEVRNGFANVTAQNSISLLKTRRYGFIEVPEVPSMETEFQVANLDEAVPEGVEIGRTEVEEVIVETKAESIEKKEKARDNPLTFTLAVPPDEEKIKSAVRVGTLTEEDVSTLGARASRAELISKPTRGEKKSSSKRIVRRKKKGQ